MNYKWICLVLLTLIVPAPVRSDEPGAIPGIKKQRVSPKLLREAMATPEYKARVNLPPPPSIDQIQKLADKLEMSGDKEDSALLRAFILEHQRLANQSPAKSDSTPSFTVRCQLVALNDADIAANSILRTATFDDAGQLSEQLVETFNQELERSIHENKGTRLLGPVTITAHAHKPMHFHQGGSHALPTSDGSVPRKVHETGTILDIKVAPQDNATNQVELSIQIVSDESHANQPHVDRKKHSTVVLKNGGISIIAVPGSDQESKVFLVTKVARNALEVTAVPKQ